MKRLLIGAAAVSLVGVLGTGIAGAAPTPKYTVSCTVGGTTTATWQRAKLSQIAFTWFAPPGSTTAFPNITAPLSPTPPRGTAVTGTPTGSTGIAPATVTVTFQHADGSGADQVTTACT